MRIEISNGELLDKVTILQIKANNILDEQKKVNVMHELDALLPQANALLESAELQSLFKELRQVNEALWSIEDDLREKERLKVFDGSFIQLARSVYFTNDKRASIKKQINIKSNSDLVEEKSYEQY
jgi:Family of unknown function (DUF6165)